tara:strand:+ start:555 stop:1199 length:645 start_codon:yes stop_codon:yes gene_type:complete
MKIFLDTAIVCDIDERISTGIIKGVTTNPTLIAKSGRNPDEVYEEIFDLGITDLSIEIKGDRFDELIVNGLNTHAKYGKDATIKLPCTVDGVKACKYLTNAGIRVNMTLVFSVEQAILCSMAGATYVSPFIGRLNDIGQCGISLIRDISEVFCQHNSKTKILAASVRDNLTVGLAFEAGAHICTLPPVVFDDMFKHELTDAGLKQFALDFGANV